MTVVLIEGFDHLSSQYTIKGWSHNNGSQGTGRLGTGKCVDSQNSLTMVKTLPATYTSIICGFAMRNNIGAGANNTFVFQNASTVLMSLRVTAVGANNCWSLHNSAGTQIAIGTTPYPSYTWWYFEIKFVVSATVGSVELRINGQATAECSASGLNTGTTPVNVVGWTWYNGLGCSMDDVYVIDTTTGSSPTNTFLGDVRVETIFPSGNGTNTAFTGAYTDWDDTTSQDGDSTYVSSSTPGDKETSALGDMSITAGNVYAVQTNLTARKDDAGVRTIAPVLRIGSTDYDGTTTPGLGTSYADYTQLYDRVDPAGNPWSIATVNAMEAGAKVVT
jgi:hypothetical protein